MKTKYTHLVPALALAALTPVMAQSTGVDKSAANYKEGKFSDYLEIAEKAIEAKADDLPEEITSRDIFKAIGFGNITTYAQSSTPQGTEWINKIRLNNGGKNEGALKLLLDSKHKGLSVPTMAPAGTDLAVQFSLNLSSLEPLISGVMETAASDEDKAEFKTNMSNPVPMMDMTTSELLKKLDVRLNLALDMDPAEQIPTPLGAFDKPNLVIRLDGASWAWAKVGAQLIGSTGLPFAKAEANGVTTYSLPAEMTAQFMGYSPVLSVDTAKDQIWIASTPEFLTKSSSGKNTLAQSAAYKATMAGLPNDGVSMSYVSKDFADFLTKTLGSFKEKGMLEGAGEDGKAQIESALEQLAKVKTGMASVLTSDAKGILMSSRDVQNIEEEMAEVLELLKTK